jgi:sn-glycerol 3-phosphate transport system permease protein
MVERRPLLDLLSHGVMLVGVLVVAFPVYLTFVASTHTAQEIIQAPMPLLPGDQFCTTTPRSHRQREAARARARRSAG